MLNRCKTKLICILSILVLAFPTIGMGEYNQSPKVSSDGDILGFSAVPFFAYSQDVEVEYAASSFTATTNELSNPYQGFYTLTGHSFYPGMGKPDLYIDKLTTPLLLVEFNISKFGDGDIGQSELDIMNWVLDQYDASGKSVIMRFLYDWNGKALQYEPSSIDVVKKHMAQVAPVLNSHKDMILLHQGIFIGNCAEMNNSKFGTDEECTQLYLTLESVLDKEIPIGVRTPRYHRMFTAAGADVSRIAFYNDGMFGSDNDLGTYSVEGYDRQTELDFQDYYARYVPSGGEATLLDSASDVVNCIPEMYLMHISHLNKDHYTPTLNKWKSSAYFGDEGDIWNGSNAYTYIAQHMGYRYEIQDFQVSAGTKYQERFLPVQFCKEDMKEDYLTLSVGVYDSGFASAMKPLIPYITLTDEDGRSMTFQMNGDMTTLHSRESKYIDCRISVDELKKFDLYDKDLTASFFVLDKRNGQEIQIATECEKDQNSHYIVGTLHCR